MIRFGVDPGFGNFKVVTVDGSVEPRAVVIPSVVGVGETNLGLLSLGQLGRKRRQSKPNQVTFSGVTYLVGKGVARFARPVQRMDFLRLSDGPELRALFYNAVFPLLDGGSSHQAALMIGLPVEVMADRGQARDTLRALRHWMIATHRFAVDGAQVTVTVTDVQAMAQPAGTFFAWGLGNDGKWARDKADLKAPVAVCDIGFNTLDLFAVQSGEVVARFTGGDTVGMRRAAELLVSTVRAQYGVELSLHEADGLLYKRRPMLHTTEGEVNLRVLVNQALDNISGSVIAFIEQRWGNGRRFAHLLFTGGGSEALRDTLLRHYPHGIVLPNPVTANAVGLARYAVRVFGNG